ncbi:GM12625 [Drosophila sechellia]|uniref:GM12625 n=1 Tax=Drosophila sechellia TaxID=7238 RepID=B4I0L0_DROSE|nr:GM12625 [Drosophila sechellia]
MPPMIHFVCVLQLVGHKRSIGMDASWHHQLPLTRHQFVGMESVKRTYATALRYHDQPIVEQQAQPATPDPHPAARHAPQPVPSPHP